MRKSRSTEEQIIGVLKATEAGQPVQALCRKHGISEQTFCRWKSKYGGMEVNEARRLRTLEGENRRLKTLVATTLDNQMLKTVVANKWWTPTARRLAVGFVQDGFGVSQRRSCRTLGVDRSTCRHVSRRSPDPLREPLRVLAARRPRFGYRRLGILLR